MHPYRTHRPGTLRAEHIGESVRLSGWVHARRDHGGLIFLDLRDSSGIAQIVASPELAGDMRVESVITVDGDVVARQGTVNTKIATGDIEIVARHIRLENAAEPQPIQVAGNETYGEQLRLAHRYVDLRRAQVQKTMQLRSDVIRRLRAHMHDLGFTEYQTPLLTASSPEGARDFLVPSRLQPGKFYALPQAPQIFKQLLMVGGIDRYFQIAPCFRDEAARADRSPGEFYQLDFEMAFATQDEVFAVLEYVLQNIFTEFADGRTVHPEFPRITYADAMRDYGSDKPDLRNPLKLHDVTELFADSTFPLIIDGIAAGHRVQAIRIPGGATQPRSWFQRLDQWGRDNGMSGVFYLVERDNTPSGPMARQLPPDQYAELRARCNMERGDAMVFTIGYKHTGMQQAGALRTHLGHELSLVSDDEFRFCWIIDFPMFEYNEDTGRIDFSHNPFSMPQGGMDALQNNPLDVLAHQYDIVCNGIELCSGAIRNHRPDIMLKAFDIAGYTHEEIETQFGGILKAFRSGAPPHGGAAPGVDRMVMLLANTPNIREVVLFPLNQQGVDPLLHAPAPISDHQWTELQLSVVHPTTKTT